MPAAAPGAPPSGREEIGSPLDTLGKILYDVDITTFIMSNMDKGPEETAQKIWMLYGGNELGDAAEGRKGERDEKKNVDPEKEEAEQERTEKTRWKRLPKDKMITDITNIDELVDIIKGLTLNLISNEKKKGAGGPGGMPSLAAAKMQIRLARALDRKGDWSAADRFDRQTRFRHG